MTSMTRKLCKECRGRGMVYVNFGPDSAWERCHSCLARGYIDEPGREENEWFWPTHLPPSSLLEHCRQVREQIKTWPAWKKCLGGVEIS